MKKFLPPILVFIILLVAMPRSAKLSYDYRKGAPWKYETLVAPFAFPVLKTEDQLLEERRQASAFMVPYYKSREDLVSAKLRDAHNLDLGEFSYMRPEIAGALKRIYDKGITGEDAVSAASDVVYVQKNKRVSTCPAIELYNSESARAGLLTELENACPGVNVDSLLTAGSVYDLLVPNLEYDAEASRQISSDASLNISPTSGYVNAGQVIVSHDEIVTAEIAQMISSYEKEYDANMRLNTSGFLFWTGNCILALLLVVLFYFAICFVNPGIFSDQGKYLYLSLIFTLFTLASTVLPGSYPESLYFFPFVLCALLLEAFFDNRLVVIVYAISLLPLVFFAEGGRAVFTVFLAGGTVSIITFKYFSRGWRQFLNAIITFAVLFIVFLAFRLTDLAEGNILRVALALAVSAFLCVAGYPLTYLFEKIFNLVSVYRLRELCDTSSPLLRELEQKAPGTFQHSLQVMNMADAVAGAIGANVQLVRAGALYHDIGKMMNPLCFVENESMLSGDVVQRYHEKLSPLQSAQDIIRHVTDGDELAQKHHLPSVIRDFILTHHGTTVVSYFYDKFLKAGGSESEIGAFSYPGMKPVTREQSILMLCDSIEAASRSLKDFSAESFSRFVEGIVAQKMDEGQFEEAQISVKDLGIVKNALKNYLAQMYHGRIAYPKRKSNTI